MSLSEPALGLAEDDSSWKTGDEDNNERNEDLYEHHLQPKNEDSDRTHHVYEPASASSISSSSPPSGMSERSPSGSYMKKTMKPIVTDQPLIVPPESFLSYTVKAKTKGKGKEVNRGRTLERLPRTSRSPARRAGPSTHRANVSIVVDSQSTEDSMGQSNSSYSRTVSEEHLEPWARTRGSTNLSDIDERPIPRIRIDTPNPISGLRRTGSNRIQSLYFNGSSISNGSSTSPASFFNSSNYKQPRPVPTVLPEALYQLLSEIDSINQSLSRSSSPIMRPTRSPAPKYSRCPKVSEVPAEILQQVYHYLGPVDFNSARHACRSWYVKSLQTSLLETMLERGGWSSSVQRDRIVANHIHNRQFQEDDSWLLNKHISRECALSPDWKGDGLSFGGHRHHTLPNSGSARTSFVHIATTDLTELGLRYPSTSYEGPGLTFTASACGKFLMAACERMIYIYELNRTHRTDVLDGDRIAGAVRPITSIMCPRRVISCSMDTSSERYAIGVLMDGRMGLVCSLKGNFGKTKQRHFQTVTRWRSTSSRRNKRKHSLRHNSTTSERDLRRRHSDSRPGGRAQVRSADTSTSAEIFSTLSNTSPDQQPAAYSHFASGNVYIMHTEKSLPTVYLPLCSPDDPPRSVAICPQRRCIAFGCSSGVELRWADALTGQDHSRWFPLTAPCDYLYFLPPRAGVDSMKKLRLISSARQPAEQCTEPAKLTEPRSQRGSIGSKRTSPFRGILPSKHCGNWIGLGATANGSGAYDSEHYHAIPLSDGYHILFTDPVSGLLCFGIDAPVGSPTKLLRKIWFKGPEDAGSPLQYAVGTDLRWGVRIVAAYDSGEAEQRLWLFSIPYDVYIDSMDSNGVDGMISRIAAYGFEGNNNEWMEWWDTNESTTWNDRVHGEGPNGVGRREIWPMQIRGQEIGRHRGIADLAIESGLAIIIWAFGSEGIAKTWQLDNNRVAGPVTKRFILADGNVHEADAEGDIEMLDAWPGQPNIRQRFEAPETPPPGYYDGTGSAPDSPNKRRRTIPDEKGYTNNSKARVLNKLSGSGYSSTGQARPDGRDTAKWSNGIATFDVELR